MRPASPRPRSAPQQDRSRVEPLVPLPRKKPDADAPKARDIREVDTTEYDESNAGEGPD